jgi:acyl-CoA synthetase (NDP forming)
MRAYDALFRECGVPVVRSIETLAAVCTLVSDPRALQVRGDTWLIGVSGSGGGCSLMADHAAEREIMLAGDGAGAWEGETARLIATFKGIGLVRNPIDGGNLHGWDKLPSIIEAMERDGLSGPIAGFAHRLPTLASDMALFTPLAERKQRTGSPVVMMSPGGQRPEMQTRYAAEGIPLFPDLAACFDSLRAYYDALDYALERDASEAGTIRATLLPSEAKRAIEASIASPGGTFLSELESADVLRMAGVEVVQSRTVTDADEAAAAAEAAGYPVVMKAIVPGIAHKNDAGLVVVGVRDAATAREAFGRLVKVAGRAAGRRIVVQPMVSSRAEIIVGTTHEPGLGHFLLAGLGGVHAEVLDSVLVLPSWITPERIRRRLRASKLGALLDRLGRGSGRDHTEEVARTLDALQRLVSTLPDAILSIDVNPLMIGPEGAIAVDALVVPRRQA